MKVFKAEAMKLGNVPCPGEEENAGSLAQGSVHSQEAHLMGPRLEARGDQRGQREEAGSLGDVIIAHLQSLRAEPLRKVAPNQALSAFQNLPLFLSWYI